MIPSIGQFHTRLRLADAFLEYDAKYRVTKRRFVKPSFNDIRHVFNLAQVNELAADTSDLRLITLDGDCTLYSDGKNFEDEKLARFIGLLLCHGVHVALVTAAGYGYDSPKYETRIGSLLASFSMLPDAAKRRFFVLGGECNYLLQCNTACRLEPIPEKNWTGLDCHGWSPEQVQLLLDTSEATLTAAIDELQLRTRLIRKARAIGMIVGGKEAKLKYPDGSGSKNIRRELLDECVLRVHAALKDAGVTIPFCAFNGGSDVWVDVGNKKVGVEGLQKYLGLRPEQTMHVGDQFTNTGNDFAARSVATTTWILHPTETRYILKTLLTKLGVNVKVAANDDRSSKRARPEIAQ